MNCEQIIASDDYEMLKLKIMLHFLHNDGGECSVVKIARTLDVTKQRVSRVLMNLEKEGFVDRSDQRHPLLTDEGQLLAAFYQDRIEISLNHLLFEGVSLENAERDAYSWAIHNTDETMKVIRDAEAKYRVKYELRDRGEFDGSVLCKALGDGVYPFNFVMYRQSVKNGKNLSMANEGFEHPGYLSVRNGIGKVRLRAIDITATSPVTKTKIKGKVDSIRYLFNGDYIPAEVSSDILTFPAEVLSFVNIGDDINQFLHGSVCLKIRCTVYPLHMPESVAVFTMIF